MSIDVSPAQFDELVDAALDAIPPALAERVHNLVVLVEAEPPLGEPDDLLGLYDGIALTERGGGAVGELPDRIFIFRGPLMRMCRDLDELVAEIRITVVHEVAHHFGIDDERLHELGWA